MARHPMDPPRKKRSREHILADLSANYVERIALSCGWAVDRIWHDYGLDLAVFTFDDQGYLQSGVIWIQVKASDKLKETRDGSAFRVRLQRRDILAWLAEAYPVILVVYDARRDCAYWLSIQGYFASVDAFRELKGKTITVSIPMDNVLNKEAIQNFAREKAAALAPGGLRL